MIENYEDEVSAKERADLSKLIEQLAPLYPDNEIFHLLAMLEDRPEFLSFIPRKEDLYGKLAILAATFGKIRLFRYLADKLSLEELEKSLYPAVSNGHVGIIKCLQQKKVSLRFCEIWAGISKQYHVIKYLNENGLIQSALSKNGELRLSSMRQELSLADPIYHPAKFWVELNASHVAHLHYGGEANFKRTINRAYSTFIPTTKQDPLIVHLSPYFRNLGNVELYTIDEPDNDPNLWFSFIREYQIFDGNSINKINIYLDLIVKMYECVSQTKRGYLLKQITEPELGNPIRIYREDKLISQELMMSIMEFNSILEAADDDKKEDYIIGELGAGYGRLPSVFLRTMSNARYMVFDIPPALYIAEWYLLSLFPEKRVFKFRHFESFEEIEEELNLCQIAFFTPNQLEKFPKRYFDIFITISSLHEMKLEQINHYLSLITNVTKDFIYIKQYWKYINPSDNLVIYDSDYILPDEFKILKKEQDPLNPYFFELVAKRNRKATISVLLSNYNYEQYLPKALTAICNQSVLPDEVIVLDDGSTDRSVEVIEKFSREFKHIRFIRNEKNMGLLVSINKLLTAASSDYIVWASSDDILLPHFIEENVKCLEEHPDAGLSFSRLAVFRDGTDEIRYYSKEAYGQAFDMGEKPHYLSPQDFFDRLKKSYLWMSGNTVVAKRKFVQQLGFIPELRWHADWFTYYVIALRHGACMIPETLALMREHGNTFSKKGMQNPREQHRVLKALSKKIHDRSLKDIYPFFLERPCLLSPFGHKVFYALVASLKLRLAMSYLKWYLFKHKMYHEKIWKRISQYFKKITRSSKGG